MCIQTTPAQPDAVASAIQFPIVAHGTCHFKDSSAFSWWLLTLPTPEKRNVEERRTIAISLGLTWRFPERNDRPGTAYRIYPTFRQRGRRLLIYQRHGLTA